MDERSRLKWKGNRKRWLQSFLAIMVVFTMLFTSMPVTMLGSLASYTVYVGGMEMTVNADGSNASYYVNGIDGAAGTVYTDEPQEWNAKLYYDTNAGCLVLVADGLEVDNAIVKTHFNAAIYSENSIAIMFENQPSIIGGGDTTFETATYGIYCEEDLLLQVNNSGTNITSIDIQSDTGTGGGSYGIYASNISIKSADKSNVLYVSSGAGINQSAGRTAGIYAGSELTFHGGEIHATCGGSGTAYNDGVHGYSITVNADTVLYANGGAVGPKSYGIYAGGTMTIKEGAEVYAQGGGNASMVRSAGLCMGDLGSFIVEGGILQAIGKEATDSYGVYGKGQIRGGDVMISSEGGTDISYAVYKTLDVVGGTVVLSCDDTATNRYLASSITFSDAEQTNNTWYQWTTTDGGSMTKSKDQTYILDTSHTYLKIEKDVPHTHTICGQESCSSDHDKDGNTDGHSEIEFEPWDGTDKDTSNAGRQLTTGNYYLSQNVTIDSTVMIVGTVNLCLNGYALKYENANAAKGSVIQVNAGATLNLCDCNGSNSSHTITAPITGEVVTITGGLITGGTGTQNTNPYYGGGIYVLGTMTNGVVTAGIVNQYGGTIAGNTTGRGGGVAVRDGEYSMFGGRIAYNQSSAEGGGVFVIGTGRVSSEDRYPTEFCMYADAIIDNNKSNYCGGGIATDGFAVVRMEGESMVTENRSSSTGAGIYQGSSPAGLQLSENVKVTNNISNYTYSSGGIYVLWGEQNQSDDFKVSGNVQITGNKATYNNVTADANVEIRVNSSGSMPCILVNGSLGENALIPLTIKKGSNKNIVTDVFSSGGAGYYIENFKSEVDGYFIAVDETANELKFVDYQITEEPSLENDYEIDVNYETGVQYEWYEITTEQITGTTNGVTAVGNASCDTNGWWTGYSDDGGYVLKFFTIPLNEKDIVQIEINHLMDEGQVGMWDEEQVWDFDPTDLYSNLIAPENGSYTVVVGANDVNNPTSIKAKVLHVIQTLNGNTNQLTGATSGKDYICKVTYEDGTVLFSEPFTYMVKEKLDAPTGLSAVAESILGKGDGKITGLTTEMEYSTSESGPFIRVTDVNMNLAADTYYVRYAEKQNYIASDAVQVLVPNGPAVKVTTPENPKFEVSLDKAQVGWHEDVTITIIPKDGYTLTPDPEIKVNGEWVDDVDIQAEQKAVFTIENVEGDIYIEATGIIDTTAPAIKISVAENEWNKFWNELTFGILFNETQTVTITATDAGSGIEKVYYYLSKNALTFEEVKALSDWTEYKKAFEINPENEYIIYAKAVDKEGNVTYVNSDNLILLIPGNYEDVTPDTNLGGAKLDVDIEELKQDIPFTEKELEQVKMGADVDVWLSVEDISDTVSDEDKKLIAEKLGDNQIGMYMDVSMFKQVGTNPAVKLTQLNDTIRITFEVPTELLNENQDVVRSYQIIRVHDGAAEILDAEFDAEKKTISFETDSFSTYAILYKDVAVDAPPVDEPPADEAPVVVPPVEKPVVVSPKTDDSGFILWIALLFVSGGVIYSYVTEKKKKKVR